MKKVTIKYPHNGRRITQFVTEVIDELDNDKTAYAKATSGLGITNMMVPTLIVFLFLILMKR